MPKKFMSDRRFRIFLKTVSGTTIDPFTFTIHSPSITGDSGSSVPINLADVGVTQEALNYPEAFLIMIQAPVFGQIKNDGKILDEDNSVRIDSKEW